MTYYYSPIAELPLLYSRNPNKRISPPLESRCPWGVRFRGVTISIFFVSSPLVIPSALFLFFFPLLFPL